jgi:hypothetical protein
MDSNFPNVKLEIQTCPGCGCEPEIQYWFVEKTKERKPIGYHCACGAMVQYGILVGSSLQS